MDVKEFYADLLYQYVAQVRKLADQLWVCRDITLDRLLYEGFISSSYGVCIGLYRSLMALYHHCDTFPRPVNFRDMLRFPRDLEISGPHFDAQFLLDFYPEVHTLFDAVIDTIKRNPDKYLQEV